MTSTESIWTSTELPTLPGAAMRLLEYARDQDAELADFVAVIKSDPAMAAKLLRVANSSFFSFASKVTTIERAVSLLGKGRVATLVLSFSLVDNSFSASKLADYYQNYWAQSVSQAIACELLCQDCRLGDESEFFLAGMLLDLGRLALLKSIPDSYQSILDLHSTEIGVELHSLERRELGFDHAEIGVGLLTRWGIEGGILQAVGEHHGGACSLDDTAWRSESPLVSAAVLAAAVGDYFFNADKGRALTRLRSLGRRLFRFDDTRMDQFLEAAWQRIEEGAGLFSANVSMISDPAQLLAKANEQLVELAMQAQAATERSLERQRLIEDQNQALLARNEELERRAVTDLLTGLVNRAYFSETLRTEVARCQRNKTPLGILFCDVDHFKKLNDTHGHQFGDYALQRVARAMSLAIRSCDVLARYGGEEFIVLAVDSNEETLGIVAERIRRYVEAEEVMNGDQRIPITISIGGCAVVPELGDPDVTRRILDIADQAMYAAKQAGRNRAIIRGWSTAGARAASLTSK